MGLTFQVWRDELSIFEEDSIMAKDESEPIIEIATASNCKKDEFNVSLKEGYEIVFQKDVAEMQGQPVYKVQKKKVDDDENKINKE